ncbi:MAG TPA: iron ABC transporter permease [Anaerolineae bacterium]|nr:iron ABC transporter permease [Anaerolineae bacterium]
MRVHTSLSQLWKPSKPLQTASQRPAPRGLVVASAVVVGLVLLPLVYLLLRAAAAPPAAWQQLFQPRTLAIMLNSAVLTVTVTAASIALAVPLAWLLAHTDLPGRRVWTVLLILPLVVPSYVGAFSLLAMFGPRGILQGWLAPLGVERLPEIYGLPGAWLTLTLFTYPYVLLTVRAGWRRLDASLEEAGRSLGHGPWGVFRRVTLPHLRPSIAAGGLLVALYTLSDFGAVSLLRANVFTEAIYTQYRSSFDRSYAALLSLVLVAATLAILWAEQRARGRARTSRAHGSSSRPLKPVTLGRWRWPALALVASVALLALALPVGVMLDWLVLGLQRGETWPGLGRAAVNSLRAAGLAALVTVLAGLPIAVLAARNRTPVARGLERASYVGFGLPGVVVGLSLVFFGANYLPALYQTLVLLVFAYAVRFVPEAMGSARSSLVQVSPRLEEAARSLGLSPLRAWLRVTLPLARPGILAGGALVFLTVLKELPLTLMLAPTGFATLATQIWSATAEAFYARAALPALLLLAVSSLSVTIIISQDRDHA